MPRSRILVIDDEASIRDALRLVITELGHHVAAIGLFVDRIGVAGDEEAVI